MGRIVLYPLGVSGASSFKFGIAISVDVKRNVEVVVAVNVGYAQDQSWKLLVHVYGLAILGSLRHDDVS